MIREERRLITGFRNFEVSADGRAKIVSEMMTMISRIVPFDNYIARSNLWCWKFEIEIEDLIS